MEKQILTALLVLVLVAPQTGLEAKSRHHGVKERDHDAEERYHKSKNRYHKAKKRHHSSRKFFRFARATKAELELLKQAISEINAKMDELEPQSQLPAILAADLVALQRAINGNTSAIGANTSEITMALDEIIEIMVDIDSIIARISALESGPEPPDGEKLVFSGHFMSKKTPTKDSQLVLDWLEFRSIVSLYIANGGLYTSIEIRGSVGGGVSCFDPDTATAIANALNSGLTYTINCENRVWNVGPGNPRTGGGGIELNAGSNTGTGTCLQEASVRPLMGNSNWGGIGFTCVAPSQTLEVILTLNNTVL